MHSKLKKKNARAPLFLRETFWCFSRLVKITYIFNNLPDHFRNPSILHKLESFSFSSLPTSFATRLLLVFMNLPLISMM